MSQNHFGVDTAFPPPPPPPVPGWPPHQPPGPPPARPARGRRWPVLVAAGAIAATIASVAAASITLSARDTGPSDASVTSSPVTVTVAAPTPAAPAPLPTAEADRQTCQDGWVQAGNLIRSAQDAISVLPPELMRKGRFDEIFFVDLPTEQERVNILKIHLERKEREPEDFDLLKIARATVGFSGSELEELINEALYNSFDNGRELTDSDLIECISKVCPISKTMAETINSLRKWAKVRARIASNHQPEEVNVEKGMPRLPQEARNPFMA